MKTAVPPIQSKRRRRMIRIVLVLGVGVAACISTCSPRQGGLERVRTMNVLRVATVNSPTTYYIGPDGPTGYEYDLVKGFADRLDVKLEIVLASGQQEAVEKVASGAADLGAAGLAITSDRERNVRFTPPINSVMPELVYRTGQVRPHDLDDLKGRLAVPEGSNEDLRLKQLRNFHPRLRWDAVTADEAENLLEQVGEGELDYTIANSDLVAINQRYFPKLAVAFGLTDAQQLAWALAPGDDALLAAANDYLRETSGIERKRLRERYFGQVMHINQFSSATLAADVGARLPRFRKWFEEAGSAYNVDWRLVAAMGYQESRWDPAAVSPTGVRGLMMLTSGTAAHLNVANREDPKQSIDGGARYFRQTLDALPPEIREPDRSWMALATYNIGMAHLIDVRKLTHSMGGNANQWIDVRKTLPLLTQQRWFSKTEYGYARGHEAVTYVNNVRTYYDMLVWMTTERPPLKRAETLTLPQKKEKKPKDPLNINAPVL